MPLRDNNGLKNYKDKIVIFVDSDGCVESVYSNSEPVEIEVVNMSELDTKGHYKHCKENLKTAGFKNIY